MPSLESAQEKLENQAKRLLADLVQPAKIIALDKLGQGRAALGIATSWYRAKVEQKEAAMGAESPTVTATL